MPIFPLHFSTAMDTETMTHPPRPGSMGLGTCQDPAICLCVPNELFSPRFSTFKPAAYSFLLETFLFWGICDTSSPLDFLLCCPRFSVQVQRLRLLISHLPDSSHLPSQLHVPSSLCCSVHVPLTPYVFAFLQVPCSDLFKTFPHVAPCARTLLLLDFA